MQAMCGMRDDLNCFLLIYPFRADTEDEIDNIAMYGPQKILPFLLTDVNMKPADGRIRPKDYASPFNRLSRRILNYPKIIPKLLFDPSSGYVYIREKQDKREWRE